MTTNKNPELSVLIIPVIKIADEGNGDSLIITFLDPVGIGMIFPEDQGGKFLFGQIAGFFQVDQVFLAFIRQVYLEFFVRNITFCNDFCQHGQCFCGIFIQGKQAYFGFIQATTEIHIGPVIVELVGDCFC